jgi:hypothetical protein
MDSRSPNDPRNLNWKITDPVEENERYLTRPIAPPATPLRLALVRDENQKPS